MVISLVIDDGGIGSSPNLSSRTAPVVQSWMNAHFAMGSTGPHGVSPAVPPGTVSYVALPFGGRAANAAGTKPDKADPKARRRDNFMVKSPAQVVTQSPISPTAMA